MNTVIGKIGNGPDKAIEALKKARARLNVPKKTVAGKTFRVAGVSALWLSEYFVRFVDVLAVNNAVLRGGENLFKKAPWAASYLLYFSMVFGAGMVGNELLEKYLADKSEKDGTEKSTEKDSSKELTYISPDRKDFIDAALEEYWPEIAVGLTELETYREKPTKHPKETRYTNGLGTTWHYVFNDKGVLEQLPNTKSTKANSKEYNYEQVKRHLKHDTFKSLKNATLAKQNMNARYAIALVLAGYQIPSDIKHIAARIEKAKTRQDVADAFIYVGDQSKGWETGTLKRRWVCAAYALNLINSTDLLNMNRDCFSKVELNSIIRDGHFLLGPETVSHVLGRTNSNSTVKSFLSDFSEGKEILARVDALNTDKAIDFEIVSQQDKTIEESIACINKGDKLFERKKFEKAAEYYAKAIEIDSDNMDAYTQLAKAYNELGREKNSIEYYNKATEVVSSCNARMNKNKALLYDRDIKAETYYTAGQARFAMAEAYVKSGDTKAGKENYMLAKKNFETAIYNCKRGSAETEILEIYQDALDGAQNKLKTKTIAFNDARGNLNKKIKEKNAVYEQNSRIQRILSEDKLA